jgi:oxalate---CoA ligase
MDSPVSLITLVGHSGLRVVCSRHSEAWVVTVNEEPRINILPRRWLDIRGIKVQETWRAALRAVLGTIVFRPGISQVRDRL